MYTNFVRLTSFRRFFRIPITFAVHFIIVYTTVLFCSTSEGFHLLSTNKISYVFDFLPRPWVPNFRTRFWKMYIIKKLRDLSSILGRVKYLLLWFQNYRILNPHHQRSDTYLYKIRTHDDKERVHRCSLQYVTCRIDNPDPTSEENKMSNSFPSTLLIHEQGLVRPSITVVDSNPWEQT